MKITLDSMTVKNFKGIEHYELKLGGKNASIKANNRRGKTTLADAFTWVLFGKDTLDRQEFGIRPTDKHGNIIEGLEPEVECRLLIDDKPITFKRVLKPTNTGTTTQYFVNDIRSKTKREYDTRVEELINAETFKLLANPMHFIDLHWEKQRETLLEFWGSISQEAVIKTNNDFTKMPEILGEHTLDEKERWLKDNIKPLKTQLKRISIQIEEQERGVADKNPKNIAEIKSELEKNHKHKKELEQELNSLSGGSIISEKRKRMAELETEVIELKGKFRADWQNKLEELREKLGDNQIKSKQLEMQMAQIQNNIEDGKLAAGRYQRQMDELREHWHKVNKEPFSHLETTVCPYCEGDIPESKKAELKQNALEIFNAEKSKRLEVIQQKGIGLKNECDVVNENIAKFKKRLEMLGKMKASVDKTIGELRQRITQTQDIIGAGNTDQIRELQDQISNLFNDIEELENDTGPETERVKKEIDSVDETIATLNRTLAEVQLEKEREQRVKELVGEQRRVATELESLEGQLSLLERFTFAKVELAEKQINSAFEFVQWKLFETQANGTVVEVCKPMVNGVAYKQGLNTEGTLNAGLDVINAFADKLKVSTPIFIDNAESTSSFIKTKGQIIKLIKPEIRTKTDEKRYSDFVLEFEEVEER